MWSSFSLVRPAFQHQPMHFLWSIVRCWHSITYKENSVKPMISFDFILPILYLNRFFLQLVNYSSQYTVYRLLHLQKNHFFWLKENKMYFCYKPVNISHINIPYDQTSHNDVYFPKFNASGAVHLIGICFIPSDTVEKEFNYCLDWFGRFIQSQHGWQSSDNFTSIQMNKSEFKRPLFKSSVEVVLRQNEHKNIFKISEKRIVRQQLMALINIELAQLSDHISLNRRLLGMFLFNASNIHAVRCIYQILRL